MATYVYLHPETIKAREPITYNACFAVVDLDDSMLFLSVEQARDLWLELGTLLQSHDALLELAGAGEVLCATTRTDKAEAIRDLEDLRGLPHSDARTGH